MDWSVSYFHGKDLAPDLGVAGQAGGPPGVQLSHHRVRVFGADMAANVGRFGVRAEGAYVGTEDSSGSDPFTKNPFVYLVAGTDRTFGGLLNLNVQYLYRHVLADPTMPASPMDFAVGRGDAAGDSQQPDPPLSTGVASPVLKWLHDTLEAECAPRVCRAAGSRGAAEGRLCGNRRLEGLAGAEIFNGETSSLFGLMRRN